jgi:hypothetical protein
MSPPPPNRLSIAHLMVWTFGSAVILACYRVIDMGQDGDSPLRTEGGMAIVRQVSALFHSIFLGAELGGVMLFAWRSLAGTRGFPTQPGHWILLIEGMSAMLVWTGQAAAFVMDGGTQRNIHLWAAWQLPNCTITGVAYALLLAQPGLTSAWRFACAVLSFQYCVALAAEMAFLQQPPVSSLHQWAFDLQSVWLPPLAILVVIAAARLDPDVRRRDFLHWTGIVALLGTQMLTIGFHLAVALLAP